MHAGGGSIGTQSETRPTVWTVDIVSGGTKTYEGVCVENLCSIFGHVLQMFLLVIR